MNETINFMKCVKCGEPRVSPSGEKDNPYICRACGSLFNNGIPIKRAVLELEVIAAEVTVVKPSKGMKPGARTARGEIKLNIPNKPFTQVDLATFNGFGNYKVVYSDLQRMKQGGIVVPVEEREVARGRNAVLYATPEVAAVVGTNVFEALSGLPVVAVEA